MSTKIGIRPATVVIDNGKILLVHSVYSDKSFYLFPGGGIEEEETIEEGAIRETFEETGVKVKIKKFLHLNEYIYRDDWNKRSITPIFLAEPTENQEKPQTNDGGKIKAVEWVDIDKLKEIDVRPKVIVHILKEGLKDNFSGDINRYSVDFKE